ncbi:hypothetical protein CISIN_1g0321121mg, partial [Citrus sinensis]
MMDPSDK